MKSKSKNMSRIIWIFVLILMISSCSKNPVDVTDQIKDSNRVLMDAFAAGDTAVLFGLYSKDAKLYPANGKVVNGESTIKMFWSSTLGMGIKKVQFETEIAQQFGNIAIEEGNYMLFVEGDQVVDQGKYIVTWKKENGIWKIYRDIWNANTPAPVQRATTNEKVLIVLNNVLPDKVAQFEDFYKNYLIPAATEYNAAAKKTVRLQKPTAPNQDGTFTYIFFIDPYVETLDYDLMSNLKAKYGETEAAEYMQLYLKSLKGGQSQPYMAIETDW